ncbi:hypothetical protein UPYG_G00254880 [Umbra pygmaea]|uniref:CHAT domain-containing protein n=1 Tax=Umbra pygmaea TaxID=75934 RepID=A0ABD0WCP5_UMBPY
MEEVLQKLWHQDTTISTPTAPSAQANLAATTTETSTTPGSTLEWATAIWRWNLMRIFGHCFGPCLERSRAEKSCSRDPSTRSQSGPSLSIGAGNVMAYYAQPHYIPDGEKDLALVTYRGVGVVESLEESNGQMERVNQELGQLLRSYCQNQPGVWADIIPWAEYVQKSLPWAYSILIVQT